jgi:enamine deaminase RidA (YjgF/YER057c/UK114 family)
VPTNDFAILPFTDLKNQALKNLGAVLEAGKSSFDRVLKTTILLKDMNDFAKVNTIYGKCSDFFPYRLCFCVCVWFVCLTCPCRAVCSSNTSISLAPTFAPLTLMPSDFSKDPPARATYAVAGLPKGSREFCDCCTCLSILTFPKGALVEIEAIAECDE